MHTTEGCSSTPLSCRRTQTSFLPAHRRTNTSFPLAHRRTTHQIPACIPLNKHPHFACTPQNKRTPVHRYVLLCHPGVTSLSIPEQMPAPCLHTCKTGTSSSLAHSRKSTSSPIAQHRTNSSFPLAHHQEHSLPFLGALSLPHFSSSPICSPAPPSKIRHALSVAAARPHQPLLVSPRLQPLAESLGRSPPAHSTSLAPAPYPAFPPILASLSGFGLPGFLPWATARAVAIKCEWAGA